MNGPLLESHAVRRTPAGVPSYTGRTPTKDVVARFESGPTLRIERSRERSYPGLSSEAPPTQSLYEQALGAMKGARRVLDAGCGAGAGSHLLSQHIAEVIGIDRSPSAVDFARNVAPDAKFLVADLASTPTVGSVDAAVLIDVLGHVAFPERILVALRGALPLGRKLYVAEAKAYPAQYLKAPARRSFSPATLSSLLTTSGYEIVSWERTDGPFISCVAAPFSDPAWEALQGGSQRMAEGAVELATSAFLKARGAARKDLALEAWLAEASLGLAERNGDRAIVSFFKGRELAPADPRPLSGLARIAFAMGDMTEASELAAAALRLDATEIDAACTTALISERTSPHLAKGLWLAASNLAPDSLDIALHLAQIAAQAEDCDLAVWALERVRAYEDDHGITLHLALASAMLGAGRQKDALLEVRLAEKQRPDDEGVAQLMAQLKE